MVSVLRMITYQRMATVPLTSPWGKQLLMRILVRKLLYFCHSLPIEVYFFCEKWHSEILHSFHLEHFITIAIFLLYMFSLTLFLKWFNTIIILKIIFCSVKFGYFTLKLCLLIFLFFFHSYLNFFILFITLFIFIFIFIIFRNGEKESK